MTANEARANVQAWRNNQAQRAILKIEQDERLEKIFKTLWNIIESMTLYDGATTYVCCENHVIETFGPVDVNQMRNLFLGLGFSFSRDWDSYENHWCWFIGWM